MRHARACGSVCVCVCVECSSSEAHNCLCLDWFPGCSRCLRWLSLPLPAASAPACCLCLLPLPAAPARCPCPVAARKGISNVKISAASRYYVASSQDLCKTVAELLCKLQPITWQKPDSREACSPPPPPFPTPLPTPLSLQAALFCSYMLADASNNYTVQHSLWR